MKDVLPSAPHFLRVVRAVARVSGVTAPATVVATSLFAGCGGLPGTEQGTAGVPVMTTTHGNGGAGGASTSSTTSSTSTSLGSGGFVGMPDGGNATDGGDGGH
jgi:hypothetical protein